MAKYASRAKAAISKETLDSCRVNNQVILLGNNESHLVPKGVFFVEHFEAVAGTTIAIADGEGRAVASAAVNFSNDYSPLRCDLGITITGNVTMLKGFVVESVFA